MAYKGKLISVSGIDGCGKSAIVDGLSRYLTINKVSHICVNDPDKDGIAGLIRKIIKNGTIPAHNDTILALITAVRFETIHTKIAPALSQGTHVITHRWVADSKAYQDSSKATALHREICDNLQPDFQIILDADVEVCIERLKGRSDLDPNDRYDNSSKKEMEMRKAMFGRNLFDLNTAFIDANRLFPLVFGETLRHVKKVLGI